MTLSVKSTIDEITIAKNGTILIRTNNVITDDAGIIVSQSYSRNSLVPGQDLTDQPSNIVSIANITWTPEIISNYQLSLNLPVAPATTTTTGA